MLNWVVLRMNAFGSEQKSLRAWSCDGMTSGGTKGTDEAKAAVSRRADRLTHLSILVSDSGPSIDPNTFHDALDKAEVLVCFPLPHPPRPPHPPALISPHSLMHDGGHSSTQLGSVPPEEGVGSTWRARATYGKRCDPSQNKSRPAHSSPFVSLSVPRDRAALCRPAGLGTSLTSSA